MKDEKAAHTDYTVARWCLFEVLAPCSSCQHVELDAVNHRTAVVWGLDSLQIYLNLLQGK